MLSGERPRRELPADRRPERLVPGQVDGLPDSRYLDPLVVLGEPSGRLRLPRVAEVDLELLAAVLELRAHPQEPRRRRRLAGAGQDLRGRQLLDPVRHGGPGGPAGPGARGGLRGRGGRRLRPRCAGLVPGERSTRRGDHEHECEAGPR
ncbi:hypothetical protein E1264_03880 [Actinomadura sp. KC216]|nr:hypothetical protein E1264_03880 [Actinomadura sp. KC216]